jgi:hypothetical protein
LGGHCFRARLSPIGVTIWPFRSPAPHPVLGDGRWAHWRDHRTTMKISSAKAALRQQAM